MYLRKSLIACFALLPLFISACTSGGGGDDSDLSGNTCSVIGLNTKIINGTECSEDGSPVVRIAILNGDGSTALCTGTLITSRHVLTAAHCFLDSIGASVEINGVEYPTFAPDIHPGFSINNDLLAAFNDVAVLQLGSAVGTRTLPVLISQSLEAGDEFSIYGFGLDSDQSVDILRSGEMEISAVTNDHVIASFNGDGSNTCNGDSGGPAVFEYKDGSGNTRTGIIGLVSSGQQIDCGKGDLSLFTNVANPSVLDFIVDNAPGVAVE